MAPRWLKPSTPAPGSCTIYQSRLRDLRDQHIALLDSSEMERRSRFTVQDDRDRFTLGAVLLRIAAAHSLGGEGWATAVSRTCDECGRQHGRPRLPGTRLYASVSHSSDLVVVATTAAGPVGVDVELIGGRPWQRLLSSVCTTEEQACVSTPTDFLTYWVRKEAIVKATGEGLRRELADVKVAPPDSAPSLLSILGRPTPACAMAAINVDGYTGAVAVLGSHRVRFTVIDAGVSLLGA